MSKYILRSLIAVGAVVALFTAPIPAFAVAGSGAASLSVSPSSGSHQIGSTFTVTVKETSSVPVAGVEADVHYDATKLECLGVDASGSAFVQQYPGGCQNGTVKIARTTSGTTVTGTQNVANISFKVLAGAGSTQLTFAGTSEIDDGATAANVCDSSCAEGAVAATYTLSTPAPAPAPKPAPAPAPVTKITKKASTSNTTPAPAAPAPAAPVVKDAQTENKVKTDVVQPAQSAKKKSSYMGTFIALAVLVAVTAITIAVRRMTPETAPASIASGKPKTSKAVVPAPKKAPAKTNKPTKKPRK